MIQSVRLRILLLALVSTVAIGGYWLSHPPTPQPLEYHAFADQRTLFGIPHALNVLSNLPFIVVGLLGLWYMADPASRRPGAFLDASERWPYWVYFVGLVLTGIGSSYYHANPCNETLTWDRMGLTIAFMGLFAAILAERVHPRCVHWLLGPLVLAGLGSVLYWDYTERFGLGDLRFYLTVQFFPLFVVPVLLLLYPPRYTHAGDLVASLLCYGIAKALEYFDGKVYMNAGFVSGHTLKHLVAGLAAGFILLMLLRRQPQQDHQVPRLAFAASHAESCER
jgi:hypothetical protein